MTLKALIQKLQKVAEADEKNPDKQVFIRLTDGRMFFPSDAHVKHLREYDPADAIVLRTCRKPVHKTKEKRPVPKKEKEYKKCCLEGASV